jgi:hypothetical protein
VQVRHQGFELARGARQSVEREQGHPALTHPDAKVDLPVGGIEELAADWSHYSDLRRIGAVSGA